MKKIIFFLLFGFSIVVSAADIIPCDPAIVCPTVSVGRTTQFISGDMCTVVVDLLEMAPDGTWQTVTETPLSQWSCPAASPAYGDSPFIALPSINPIADWLTGAAAAVGLGLLAGIGLIVGAPVLAAASGAAAVVAGVMTAAGLAMNSTVNNNAQSFVDAAKPPLMMTLAPSTSPVPAPVEGATSAPSVAVDPVSGKFVPGGGNLSNGSGASGGWSAGASGEWQYTPPATASNPTPAPIAEISDSGYGLKQQTKPVVGGTSSGGIYIQRYSDGSVVVTNSATVPVVTSTGDPSTLDASVSTAFGSDGVKLPGGSSVAVAPTLGNGSDSAGGAGLAVSGSGGGTTTNIGAGATAPAGGCASGDCSTESTQLANKGILQSILDFFTGAGTTPGDPTARTGNEIKGASLDGTGAFTGLKGWQLPAHASQCPTSSFAWNGNTYTFDAHCQLATDHFAAFRGVMTLVFSLSALFVVLKA